MLSHLAYYECQASQVNTMFALIAVAYSITLPVILLPAVPMALTTYMPLGRLIWLIELPLTLATICPLRSYRHILSAPSTERMLLPETIFMSLAFGSIELSIEARMPFSKNSTGMVYP